MANLFSSREMTGYLTSKYQLRTVKDVQKDEAAIIEVLEAIRDNRLSNDLVLLNYYKELPISFGANIERVERGVADLAVHKLQAVSMLMQMMTFIKSEHLPYCVIAKVLKVKKAENIALLTQFSYVHIPSEQRMYVRVTVLDRIEAFFRCGQQEVRGTIDDISYGGVAILSSQESALAGNEKGMVTLCLPATSVEIPGILLRVDHQQQDRRYVIRLEMDPKSEKILSQFIFQEQIGILRELKDMC